MTVIMKVCLALRLDNPLSAIINVKVFVALGCETNGRGMAVQKNYRRKITSSGNGLSLCPAFAHQALRRRKTTKASPPRPISAMEAGSGTTFKPTLSTSAQL